RAFDPRLETNVLAVRLFPGLDPTLLSRALDTGLKGLVLKAFGAGNVPTMQSSLIPVIEKATHLDIPVIIVSQCHRAHVELGRYESGAKAQAAGAIGAADMTDEAALTKLMVVLGRCEQGRVQAAREAFSRAVVGEMSEERRQSILPPTGGG
ncbi:MAG: L-asparaginase 1, partial [Myxococcales bacterium]|nr:L-asparaginase 1 [Myxococcales bacterium]